MKKEVRLYNMILPIWFIFYWSWLFSPLVGAALTLAVLALNFGVDTGVMFIAMRCLDIPDARTVWTKNILLVWLFGFAGDIVGNVMLFLTQFAPSKSWFYGNITPAVMMNPFINVWGLLYTLAAIAVSAVVIYLLDRYVAFRKFEDKKAAHRLAFIIAVSTAPYAYLIPTALFYN